MDVNDYQTLTKLGLSLQQSRVYMTLLEVQPATTQRVSRSANIDRSDTHRALAKLVKVGLVEEKLTKPKLFVAVPIKKAVLTLIEQMRTEFLQVEESAKEFGERYKTAERELDNIDENTFLLLTRNYKTPNQLEVWANNTKESIDMFLTEDWFIENVYSKQKFENFVDALHRGVKMRILCTRTQREHKEEAPKNRINALMTDPNFKLRYSSANLTAPFTCFDGKIVQIAVGSLESSSRFPILVAYNLSLAKIIHALFERLWNEAQNV